MECTLSIIFNIGLVFMLVAAMMKLYANYGRNQDKLLWLFGSIGFPVGGLMVITYLFWTGHIWAGLSVLFVIILSISSSLYQYTAAWKHRRMI